VSPAKAGPFLKKARVTSPSPLACAKIHTMTSPVTYLQESYDEFKKVQWPTRRQTIRLTGYVAGVSLVVGLYVAGLDFVFTRLLALVIGR